MKKLFFALIALTFFAIPDANASHLMGGEITAQNLSGNTYIVTLTLYRDTMGIPVINPQPIDVYDNTTNTLITTLQTPYNNFISGNVIPFYPYGVEVYFFIDTLTLPGAGEYRFEANSCCRNQAIQNLTPGAMQLETIVTVPSTGTNSTPIFLVPASVWLEINTPWLYNPLPVDLDGDSLHWSIDTPLTSHGVVASNYSTPPNNIGMPLTIHPQTGVVSWSANTLGNFQISVLVDEFRNGVRIGQIRRDMQLIVVNTLGSSPRLSNLNTFPQDANNTPHVQIYPNQPFQFTFIANDPNPADQIYVKGYGETFDLTTNPSTLTVSNTGNGNEVQAVYNWTPTNANLRTEPYINVLRLSDARLMYDETFLISVKNNVGIEDNISSMNITNVFPNPTKNILNVSIELAQKENLSINIYDITGRNVMSVPTKQFNNGVTITAIPLNNFTNGQYILSIKSSTGIATTKFVVNK